MSGKTDPAVRSCVVYVDTTPVATCTVAADGTVRGRFAVPTDTATSVSHPVRACIDGCLITPAGVASSQRPALLGYLLVPAPALLPLPRPIRVPGPAHVTGTGFSPHGSCSLTAAGTHAICSVDPSGRLVGELPVPSSLAGHSYDIQALNVAAGLSQTASAEMRVIGAPTTAAVTTSRSSAKTPAASPTPTDHGHGHINWRAVALWGGGAGGGGILVTAGVLAWRHRPWRFKRAPVVRVSLRSRPMMAPRPIGLHSTHVHAVQLRLRANTGFERPRRET